MNTLKINNVHKEYKDGTKALQGVDLSISDGMFGLLGPNGAGKSSLMRTIAGLQLPSTGTVEFNGVDVCIDPVYLRKRIGYLPQEFGVYPRISALDLLNHIAILKGIINMTDRKRQVDALLDKTNLYEHRKKYVSNFSGGMKRRFGIAQALLGDPQLIMVDEPTAGLDPEERNRFLDVLSEVSTSVIVILSTHIVDDVRVLCSDMAILNRGRIVAQGRPQGLIDGLSGKLWSVPTNKEALNDLKSNHQVINTRRVSGQLNAFLYSTDQPTLEAQSETSDLEHFYFYTLTQSQL